MMTPFVDEYRKFRHLVREEIGDLKESDIIGLFTIYLDRKILNPFGGLETLFKHFSHFTPESTDPDDESNDDDPFANSSGV
jgi:hypothetical protein